MSSSIEVIVYSALIGVLAVWLLLPLIPAILLYWLFPNTSITATGVLANFKINAAGAFGGYLVLFASMIPFVNQTHNFVGNFLHPNWTISGQITILDKDGREVHHQDLFQRIRFKTQPEINSFQDPVFVMALPEGQKGNLPTIILDIPDFGTYMWQPKSSKEFTRDSFNKTIEIQAPFVIREVARNVSYDARPQ
jgi:hypothetical protein